jgi:arsenite/tail-anchored protein-transporting ATPase
MTMATGTLSVGRRPLLFVGGKGGVGKTTTAAALALRLAEEKGERVLLVSTDPAHSLGDLFDRRIGDRETPIVEPGRGVRGALSALEIDPEAETDRYLEGVRDSMRAFVRPALYSEIERQIGLTRQAPGAAEAAMMDRVAELMDEGPRRWDRVIFDTAPTGHTLRLLALPELMAAWTEGLLRQRERSDALGRAVRGMGGEAGARPPEHGAGVGAPAGDELSLIDSPDEGPSDPRIRRLKELLTERRRKFSRARRLLLDDASAGFLFVLIPEKLPILETRTALAVLRDHRVPIVGLVVNRVLPPGPLGDFLEARRGQEERYLARIDAEFSDLPRVRVPLQARDVEGLEGLRTVGRALGEGIRG